MAKENDIIQSENLIFSILIIAGVLSYASPLYTVSGYIIMLALILALALGWRKVEIKKIWLMIGFISLGVIYITVTPSVFVNTQYLNNAILMAAMVGVFFTILPDNVNSKEITNSSITILDVSYFAYFFICMYELLKYAYCNIGDWSARIYVVNSTFPAEHHHVDFSVVVMLAFIIGMKRGFHILSFILAISAWIILPARTMKLFFIIFILCWLLKDRIYELCKNHKLINSCFKWMIFFVIGIIIFSLIWVFVLGAYLSTANAHEGLYDTSNMGRFQTDLYAARIIMNQKLFLNGIDTTALDESIRGFKDYPWAHFFIPHNSYLIVLLHYSVVFGGMWLFCISKLVDKFFDSQTIPYILAYLLCGCILHGMLTGPRGFMFLTVVTMPYRVSSIKIKKRVCFKIRKRQTI